ncbi:MAG TPA: hypothetical protein VKR58_09645 [Aquella sp.]|nr:hypothetical protein [Aquella sp.]
MTHEELTSRLALIDENIKKVNQEVQQSLANLNLLQGGRQECLHWLNNLSENEQLPIQEEIAEICNVSEEDNKKSTF